MTLSQPDMPRIHKALRDVKHDLCAVLVYEDESEGYAYAVAEGATGQIVAWDGWYFDPRDDDEAAPETVPLADLDWEDWDDMPTKLLIRAQSQWAADRMAFWLIPTFSPAQEAAEFVSDHADEHTTGQAASTMRKGRVVAYLPITDRDVYDRLVEQDV